MHCHNGFKKYAESVINRQITPSTYKIVLSFSTHLLAASKVLGRYRNKRFHLAWKKPSWEKLSFAGGILLQLQLKDAMFTKTEHICTFVAEEFTYGKINCSSLCVLVQTRQHASQTQLKVDRDNYIAKATSGTAQCFADKVDGHDYFRFLGSNIELFIPQ